MDLKPVYVAFVLLLVSQQFKNVENQGLASIVGPALSANDTSLLGTINFLFQTTVLTPDYADTFRDTLNYSIPLLAVDTKFLFLKIILPWLFRNIPTVLGNHEFQEIAKVFIKDVNDHSSLLSQPGFTRMEGGTLKVNVPMYLAALDYPGMISEIKDKLFAIDTTERPLDEQCYSDVMIFFDKLFVGDRAAINMFDAVGKPTTGINKGVLYFMGSYDECLDVHMTGNTPAVNSSDTYDFTGRYCRATFDPPRSLIASVAGEHINDTHGIPLTLTWGMCLPSSCSSDDIEGLLNLGLLGSLLNITVKEAHCSEDQHFEEDTGAKIVVGILGGLLGMVVICSALDLIFFKPSPRNTESISKRYTLSDIPMYDNMNFDEDKMARTDEQPEMNGKTAGTGTDGRPEMNGKTTDTGMNKNVDEAGLGSNGYIKSDKIELMNMTFDSDLTNEGGVTGEQGRIITLIRGFSVFTNIPTLMDSNTKEGDIPCLYGIRVVSMAFIVLANTFLYTALSVAEVPVAVNLMDSFSIMDRWTFQPILQTSLDTDTFFLISGCLTSYWFLVRSKSYNRKPNGWLWLKFYLGRYWKMTPPYMLVLVLFVYLYMYLGQGPMWPDRMNVAEKCKTDWWKHLIYINNLVGVDGVSAEDQCMPWSWYLAVNMQFYLISPIFLSLIVYSPSMGLIPVLIVGTAGVIAAGVKESEFGGDLMTTRTDGGAYWNNIFIKPWCRVAPFCVGIALGFLIHRARTLQKRMKKWFAAICWFVAVCPAILVLYCQYTKHVHNITPWNSAQNSAFEALSRPVWAVGVGWIVYASCEGYAGPLGDFFSWRGFVPLSRMTYMVYLIHPIVIVLFTYSKRALVHIDDFAMIYLFIGHIVISYAGAFIACLIFDLPFRNIRRAIQGKPVNTPY